MAPTSDVPVLFSCCSRRFEFRQCANSVDLRDLILFDSLRTQLDFRFRFHFGLDLRFLLPYFPIQCPFPGAVLRYFQFSIQEVSRISFRLLRGDKVCFAVPSFFLSL